MLICRNDSWHGALCGVLKFRGWSGTRGDVEGCFFCTEGRFDRRAQPLGVDGLNRSRSRAPIRQLLVAKAQ